MLPLLAIWTGCSALPGGAPGPGPGKDSARFTIRAFSDPTSKAGDEDILRMAVWVYSSAAGMMAGEAAEAFACDEGSSVTLDCKAGSKYIFTLVNYPSRLSDGTAPDSGWEFSPLDEYALLEDMTTDGILMRGSLSNVSVTDGGSRTVTVSRSVAKVSVDRITNALEEAPWAGMDVTLEAMYLLNGIGRVPLAAAATTSSIGDYYSCSAMYDPAIGPYPDFGQLSIPSLGQLSWSTVIPPGGYASPEGELYTGPNPCYSDYCTPLDELERLSDWTLRRTRLVLECIIGGYTCYYPVNLPPVSENSWCRITEVRLKHFGSLSPDVPLRFTAAEISSSVLSWDGTSINETI